MSSGCPRDRHWPRPWRATAFLLSLQLLTPVQAHGSSTEIDALLQRLAASGCEFRRGGQWHDAGAASEHLRMKHRYLLRVRPSLTTEEFIALAASSSSATRQPYGVRCHGSAERTGAEWMTRELQELRAAGRPAGISAGSGTQHAPRR